MTRRQLLALTAVGLGIFFLGAVLLSQSLFVGLRADFTESRLYSLSSGTKDVLSDLEEPIELTFVYSRGVGQTYPAVQAYAVRVRQLLKVYETRAGGRIRFKELDPTPFSEAEDVALANGIVALDTNGGDPLYFGLVARNQIDEARTIAFFAPERETSLEYDLTRIIQRLDQVEPPRIGILSSLDAVDAVTTEAGYAILSDIASTYEIESIDPAFATLPDDLHMLFIVHPPQLSDWQLWQIDQFILRTGRALILLDPAAKSASGVGAFGLVNRQIASDLNHLTERWGIRLQVDAVADTQTALSIEASTEDGRSEIVRHPLFLSVPPVLMSPDHIVTVDLSRTVNFAAAGSFKLDDTAAGQRDILIQSGPAPAWIAAEDAALNMTARDTLEAYEAGAQPAILGVRLSGPLVTAFPQGAPSLDLPDDMFERDRLLAAVSDAPPALSTSEVDAELIFLSDADIIDDSLYLDPSSGVSFADNGVLLLNALDSLSGGSSLMDLRARAPGLRPMARIDRLAEAAQEASFQEQARLEARLTEIEERLQTLQSISAEGDFFSGDESAELTAAERVELNALRDEIVQTRTALREIQRSYRKDIDQLEFWLRLVTLGLGPLIMVLMAGAVYWQRRRIR